MRIALGTVEINDYQRKAIALYYGEEIASRATCRRFIIDNGYESIVDQEIVLEGEEKRDEQSKRV